MKADAISVGAEDGRSLWLRWVLANSLAETLGLGASFVVGAALFPYLQAPGILIALATAGAAILASTLIEGTAVGTAQWLVLRRHVRHAVLWVPANALAWAPGMVLAFVAADFVFSIGMETSAVLLSVFTLAVIGAVVGAIHGVALVWLVRSYRNPG
jgi:hypothetical protein